MSLRTPLNIPWNTLKTSLKHLWNFPKHPWNPLKTALKHPSIFLKTPLKLSWSILKIYPWIAFETSPKFLLNFFQISLKPTEISLETPFNLPWNYPEIPLTFSWNTLEMVSGQKSEWTKVKVIKCRTFVLWQVRSWKVKIGHDWSGHVGTAGPSLDNLELIKHCIVYT